MPPGWMRGKEGYKTNGRRKTVGGRINERQENEWMMDESGDERWMTGGWGDDDRWADEWGGR